MGLLAWLAQCSAVGVSTGVFFLIVKAYLSHTGGIVIVPDGPDALVPSIYNFNDLKALDPAKLLTLGLPLPALPVPEPVPVTPPFLRFLLLGAHDITPPA